MDTPQERAGPSMRNQLEIITPHKLTIAILINEYFKLRNTASYHELPKKFNKDFCILLFKLTRSPDISLLDLRDILTSDRFIIASCFISSFNDTLSQLAREAIDFLINLIDEIKKLIERNTTGATIRMVPIHKNSFIGYYLRRLLISFDKLTFSEISTVLSAYQGYYEEKSPPESSGCAEKKLQLSDNSNWFSHSRHWSKRQSELFLASQAALLNTNEEKAFNPKELNIHIRNVLKTNPDLAQAHFLNYLNYLRIIIDFCGAVDSLHDYFDKTVMVDSEGNVDDENSGFRFAALSLAILHFHFGHREEALAALREGAILAQEADDIVCLQHVLSWWCYLTNLNTVAVLVDSSMKALRLGLYYLASLNSQLIVQCDAVKAARPIVMFEALNVSEQLNHLMFFSDLLSKGFAQKAALWLFYGKAEMCSLWSQLFLNIDSIEIAHIGEATCDAICNIANHFLLQGKYMESHVVLTLAKERFPNEPVSHTWMLCESLWTFLKALHREEWIVAEMAAQRMAVFDVWESHLRMTELFLHKRDHYAAEKCVRNMLHDFKIEAVSKLRIDYHVRALMLLGEIQYTSKFPNVVPPMDFNTCLVYTKRFYLNYLEDFIYLHLANVQLLMGMPAQALKLLDGHLQQVLTHGGLYDRARAMLLFVKCNVANAFNKSEVERREIITKSAEMLNDVCVSFRKLEAYARAKDVLCLQALLYNEIHLTQKRNDSAMQFRLLEEEYPSKSTTKIVQFL